MEMLDGLEELKILCARPWTRIKTIKSPSTYLLDLVVETDICAIKIFGEDHLLDDNTDTFSLAIKKHQEKTWWPATATTPRLLTEVRDLTREWSSMPVSRLFSPPRETRFFTDPDFDRVVKTRKAVLMKCVAMQFSCLDNPRAKLLITSELLNLSVYVDDECEKHILDYFIEFSPF